jgi:pimeloyl-ACP methyl ester carboxylesterase
MEIGAGNSTQPNALFEVQTQAHTEVGRQLVQRLKAGEIDGQRWSRAIWVGYSIGGLAGNSIATQYPDVIDQLAMLAISWRSRYIYPNYIKMQLSQVEGLPDFYSAAQDLERRRFSHLYGDFDPGVEQPDFDASGSTTIGEAITFTIAGGPAPEFRGPVLLALGNRRCPYRFGTKTDH